MNLYGFVGNDGVNRLDYLGLDLKLNIQIGLRETRLFASYHADKLTEISNFSFHVWDDQGSRKIVTEFRPVPQGFTEKGMDLDGDNVPETPTTSVNDKFEKAREGVTAGETTTEDAVNLGESAVQMHISGEEDGCWFYMIYQFSMQFGKDQRLIGAFAERLPDPKSNAEKNFPATFASMLIHSQESRAFDHSEVLNVEIK